MATIAPKEPIDGGAISVKVKVDDTELNEAIKKINSLCGTQREKMLKDLFSTLSEASKRCAFSAQTLNMLPSFAQSMMDLDEYLYDCETRRER